MFLDSKLKNLKNNRQLRVLVEHMLIKQMTLRQCIQEYVNKQNAQKTFTICFELDIPNSNKIQMDTKKYVHYCLFEIYLSIFFKLIQAIK